MSTALIIITSLIAAIVIFRFFMMAKMKKTPLVNDHENILTLTEQNFKQQTKNRLILIDYWASWCAPCRMMAPVLNDVADQLDNNAFVGKVDIQKYQSLASKFSVRNIPTLVLLKNGKEVDRFVGIKSKDFLLNEIAKHK